MTIRLDSLGTTTYVLNTCMYVRVKCLACVHSAYVSVSFVYRCLLYQYKCGGGPGRCMAAPGNPCEIRVPDGATAPPHAIRMSSTSSPGETSIPRLARNVKKKAKDQKTPKKLKNAPS